MRTQADLYRWKKEALAMPARDISVGFSRANASQDLQNKRYVLHFKSCPRMGQLTLISATGADGAMGKSMRSICHLSF